MALTTPFAGDYWNLGWNTTAGRPKSGYTPAVGHLVVRENAAANEWDLIAANEPPTGYVFSINSSNGVISVAMLVPGTKLILPTTGTVALGDKVEYGGTALSTGPVARTVVQEDNTNGGGRITALTPAGADTAEVTF
jgi:hypothetical protein